MKLFSKNEFKSTLFFIVPIILYIIYGLIYVFWGSFGWDEGWYLIACKKVYEGNLLYRDFGYTQTPLFPYIYGFLLKIVGYHLITARFISFLLSLGSLYLVIRITLLFENRSASALALWLISCSPFIVYFLSGVSPHPLTALFILSAVYLFLLKSTIMNRSIALSLMILATATRLTAFPGWLVLVVFLFWEHRFAKQFIIPLFTSLLVGMFVFLPFILLCRDAFFFNTILYHLQWAPSFREIFTGKMLFLYYLEQSNAIVLLLGVVLFLIYLKKGYFLHLSKDIWLVIVTSVVLVLFQSSLKRAAGIYIVNVLPLIVIAISLGLARILNEMNKKLFVKLFYTIFMIVSLIFSVLYPFKYFLNYRYYNNHMIFDPEYISEISKYIKENTPPDSRILTLDTIIPIEANRKIFRGTEMSIFSYYPNLSNEKTQKLQLLNRVRLYKYIESTTAGSIVISDGSFDGNFMTGSTNIKNETEKVTEEVKKYYQLEKTFPQYISPSPHGALYVYLPKSP